jgi:hypothetical protein
MAALVEQGFLDGDKEVEGEDAEEDVAFNAALVLMGRWVSITARRLAGDRG